MRLVQRRFFVKVEDKKPGALDAITMLFKSTHKQIVDILRAIEETKESLARLRVPKPQSGSISDMCLYCCRSQMELSCALALAQTMVGHLDLPSRSKEGLSALLVTPARDWLEQVCIGIFILFVASRSLPSLC